LRAGSNRTIRHLGGAKAIDPRTLVSTSLRRFVAACVLVVGVCLGLRVFVPQFLVPVAPIPIPAPSHEPTAPAPGPARAPAPEPATWVDHGDFSSYRFAGELAGEGARAIDVDGDFVWIGTSVGLLEYAIGADEWELHRPPFSPGRFGVSSVVATEEGRPAVKVQEYLEKKNHVRGKGAYWFDTRKDTWKPLSGGATGGRILDWDGSNLWVSLFGEVRGLTSNSEVSRAFTKADNPGWEGLSIASADSDADELWTTGYGSIDRDTKEWSDGGVSRFVRETEQWVHYSMKDGLAHKYCKDIAVGPDAVWVAHFEEERGLSRFDRRTERWEAIERSANGLEIGGVRLAIDGDDLWIGQQGGLVRLDTRTLKAAEWTESEGLPGYIISGLAVGSKYLWASVYGYGSGDVKYRSAGVVRYPR
jgi:hypothetical protein